MLGGTPDLGGIWSPILSSSTNYFNPSVDSSGIYKYTIDSGNCQAISEINITVIEEPNAGNNGELTLCINSNSINLFDSIKDNPDVGGTWFPKLQDGKGIFNPSKDMAGTYTYTISSSCYNYSSEVTVSLIDKFVISNYAIDVVDFSNSISITINEGLHYEYSLDGELFQMSTIFNNLKGGTYTVFGREVEGCCFFQEEVYILDYPRFFTPNNDGYNGSNNILGEQL